MNLDLLKGRKVIFVLESVSVGGAEKQALMMAEYFTIHHQSKIEIWNLIKGDELLLALIRTKKFEYKELMYPGSQNKWKQKLKTTLFISRLRSVRPAVLMPYLINPNVFCNAAWKKTGALACFWNQRDEGIMKFKYDPALQQKAIKETSSFISNSKGGANYLEQLGADKSKIEIIKNAISEDTFYAAEKATDNEFKYLRNDHDFIACMIANLHYNKDHFTLIKAWKIVCDELAANGKSGLLILAGFIYDVVHKELMVLINQLGISNNVKFLDFIKHPDQLLEVSDLYIHSSNSEGTSNAILEAMIHKKAIVATKIISIEDTLAPENLPYLSEPKNYKQMAGYIIQLLNNDSLRKSLGNSNFYFAKKNYTAAVMYKKMEQLLVKYIS